MDVRLAYQGCGSSSKLDAASRVVEMVCMTCLGSEIELE